MKVGGVGFACANQLLLLEVFEKVYGSLVACGHGLSYVTKLSLWGYIGDTPTRNTPHFQLHCRSKRGIV